MPSGYTVLRIGGPLLLFINAAHKLSYPRIAYRYTADAVLAALPADPFLYLVAIQSVTVALAILVLLNRFVRYAAIGLTVIVSWVTVNLLAAGFFDLALRELGLVLIFAAIAWEQR